MQKNSYYQPVIGLEIHIELNTRTKMFCDCKNDPDERRPNVNICPICTAQPGSLPVINKEAIKKVIKTGLSLNCRIPEYSKFDRKNYFYPDLPKGYQVSQLYMPFCKNGYLEIEDRKIRIREVHLEEDTGRLVHEEDYSLVDFNRAGIPLMELATEPDLRSAKEARKFAQTLHLIMHYLNVSDADMEKGQMRVEVNISLAKVKEDKSSSSSFATARIKEGELGTKVEIKNLNSFRSVERATDYEIKRQTELLNKGKKIIQETRGWLDEATASSRRVAGARVDDVKGITISQREKEEAHDYRYFPEPDLPPLHFTEKEISEIRAEIPELPQQRKERFSREYELAEEPVDILVYNKDLGEYFEKVVSELPPNLSKENLLKMTKLASNYIITDLQGLLKKAPHQRADWGLITPENFAEFIGLIYENKISSKIAKMILEEMFKTGADPSHIIEEKGLIQITDESEIEKIVKEVISRNQKVVEDFKKGKENALQFLIGQVMSASKGKANPEMVSKTLKKVLT